MEENIIIKDIRFRIKLINALRYILLVVGTIGGTIFAIIEKEDWIYYCAIINSKHSFVFCWRILDKKERKRFRKIKALR